MRYVVLLRGINVGGNNKVAMADLTAALEAGGFDGVRTYINSGKVLLNSSLPTGRVNDSVEKIIEKAFGFTVFAVTHTEAAFLKVAAAVPDTWAHDTTMRCNVMFLWQDIDTPDIIGQLPIKAGIDTVKYVPGAILWAYDSSNANKSGIAKVVGPGPYKKMTVRSLNTVRKLVALLD